VGLLHARERGQRPRQRLGIAGRDTPGFGPVEDRLSGILRSERIDIARLTEREGMLSSYPTRVLRLAFLSPAVTETILARRQRLAANVHMLSLTGAIAGSWSSQAGAMLEKPGSATHAR
jgi:hypothetical protein